MLNIYTKFFLEGVLGPHQKHYYRTQPDKFVSLAFTCRTIHCSYFRVNMHQSHIALSFMLDVCTVGARIGYVGYMCTLGHVDTDVTTMNCFAMICSGLKLQ